MSSQLFETLNKVASGEYTDKVVHASDLEVGKRYKIINMYKSKTKFGLMVVAYLENMGKIFLPKRLANIINEETITVLMEGEGSNLIYKGTKSLDETLEHDSYIFMFEKIVS